MNCSSVSSVRPVVAARVAHVGHAGDERLERVAQGRDPVDRERAHGRPVVGDLAGDRLPAALAAGTVELPRELPGRLDRLGAAGDEEDAVQVAGRERGDLGRELDRARVRVGPVRVERELAHLGRRRLADLLAVRVADLDREQARERVEVALPVDVLEVAALSAHDDRHVVAFGVRAHAREVEPEVVPRGLLQLRGREPARHRRHADRFWRPIWTRMLISMRVSAIRKIAVADHVHLRWGTHARRAPDEERERGLVAGVEVRHDEVVDRDREAAARARRGWPARSAAASPW